MNTPPKNITKKDSILLLFIRLGKQGLNCFEAANSYSDYVLRSTVSGLQRNEGITFSRKNENIPNAFGKTTSCVRYWLDEGNIAKAVEVLKS